MSIASPYGSWPSPITAANITTSAIGYASIGAAGNRLYWLESRPNEGGRTTLAGYDGETTQELTPAPRNVRSRVHEYGGGAYTPIDDGVAFVDFADQNVYLANGGIRAVTRSSADRRYADLIWDPRRARLLAVAERHGTHGVENYLAALDLADGTETVLASGHDFYASPRLSADGRRLAYLTWDHPNMPWDGTELHVADVTGDGLGGDTVVAGGARESVLQPEWLESGGLLFAADPDGWWNLHCFDDSGVYVIHAEPAEYGAPLWAFGMKCYTPLDGDHLAAERIEDGSASLVIIDRRQGLMTPIETQWQGFDSLTRYGSRLAFVGHRADAPAAVVLLDPATGEETRLADANVLSFAAAYLSQPESERFPCRDGARGQAYLYPPTNPDRRGVDGEKPPLLVTSHGGPTAATRASLNLRIQYYTSRGWTVADVNYGGSTGFGRAYRERLHGQWGIVDVNDCEDLVRHLIATGRVDADRVAIRGGSAGGYTTLAALTFTSAFRAGASHYGIGDLEALARDTHKFESRYLDSLIGPVDENAALYEQRSPIRHVDRLDCPVIFFQGLDDAIVPPNQAEAMVAALDDKGIPVAYLPFAGEQHGFRDAANIRRALEAEYLFFARVFGFEPADDLPPIDIRNL